MQRRPSSRLLIVDPCDRVLLFRFVHTHGPLSGKVYWATPGGAVEDGETFAEAACRELLEETGIRRSDVGQQVAALEFVLAMPDGTHVLAAERYFVVRTTDDKVSQEQWTALENELVAGHRWWPVSELASTSETVFPERLSEILTASGIGQ